jgi:hypothetical protein
VGETSVENYGSPIPREIVDRAKNFKIAPTTIGGMISSDLRFTKGNSPYLVKSTIEIPKGKVVYVEPGVEFDSGSLTRLTDDKGATFHVQGKVYFDGSPEERIKLFGSPVTHFQSKFAGEDAGIYANYLHVVGGRNFIGDRTSESRINFKIHNSRIRNVKNSWEIVYPFGKNELVNNHFETTSQIRALVHTSSGELRIERNKFVGRAVGQSEKGKDCWIEGVAYYGGQLRVLENDFSKVEGFALCVLYSDGQIDGRSNFWGSIDEVRIMQKVLDSRDGLSYPSIIDVSSPLSQSKYNFIGTGISASDKAVSAAKAAELAKFEAMDATIEASELARIAAREAEASAAASKLGSGSQKSTSSLGREKTISCVKGKQRLKVIGKNPKCPSGFKISK